jgi:hypothetical protein
MNQDKILELAKELYKNEEVAIELANVIFGIRDGDYEPEKFEVPVDYVMPEEHYNLCKARDNRGFRLDMLASYLGGLKGFVEGEENWYVGYDFLAEEWDYYSSKSTYFPERTYMTEEEVVIKVCEILNSGAYSLDGA